MCGRYAVSSDPDDLLEQFEVELDGSEGRYVPRYNVAPTDEVPVVLDRAPRSDPDADPVRQLRLMRWGLVPSWSKDRRGGSRMINARCEGVLDKPAYRRSVLSRRCLVPADGWYEWQPSPIATDAGGRPRKQPFFTSPADGGRPAFAGLYDFWRDQDLPPDDPTAWLTTFTVLTTAAEPGLARLHDRMPVVLPVDRWSGWLDPRLGDRAAVLDLMADLPPGRFATYPVSRRVGDVRQQGPTLLDPAPEAELDGVVDPATGELLGPVDRA
jgi:putative SOS response-associated peptidase YedK